MVIFFSTVILFLMPFFAMANEQNLGKNLVVNGFFEAQGGIGTVNAMKGNVFLNSFVDVKIDSETKMRGIFASSFGSASYESRGSSMAIDDAFVAYENINYGKIEFGITHPVTEKFRKDASTFARGSGGINGDYFRYVAYSLDSSSMILSPQMPTAGGFATSNYIGVQNNLGTLQNYFNGAQAAKISFISNKLSGFKFGASFTPSLYDKYTTIGLSQNEKDNIQDVNNNFNTIDALSFALNYEESITEKLNISISGLYENGKSQRLSQNNPWEKNQDLNSWSVGFNAIYDNWYFGGSYAYYGTSLFATPDGTINTMQINNDGTLSNFENSYLYNFGFGYATSKWGVSSSYFKGNYMNNTSDIVNLSFDTTKKVDIGTITHYLELAYVRVGYPNYYNNNNILQINNNTSAFVVFGGLRLNVL